MRSKVLTKFMFKIANCARTVSKQKKQFKTIKIESCTQGFALVIKAEGPKQLDRNRKKRLLN